MKRTCPIGLLTVLLLLFVIPAAGAAKPEGEEHVYKRIGDRKLSLYVTRPGGWRPQDRRPAIVSFHGGGWIGGAPGQFTEHAKYLASRGMVAVQVEYRLLDRSSDDPPTVCVQDAKSAMRWVRGQAEKVGVDPERIASAGGSAGGQLAAFVGMVDGLDDPQDGTAGLYHPEGGRYRIWIEAGNLDDPLAMVGTMAHELGHVHLLGHGRIGKCLLTSNRRTHPRTSSGRCRDAAPCALTAVG